MAIEYDENQFGLITSLLHQAVCEQRLEPDFSEEALGFTGPWNAHSPWPSSRTC
jgi:hypothetical protein